MLRPFFSFYGGKWRDALKNYPAPEHRSIVEPFAGSAGYSLRYPQREVVLMDIDPVVVGVWDYLIHVSAAEVRRIPDIGHAESVDEMGLCQEARWLIGFWLNRACARPRKSPSRWMRDGISPSSFWGERVRETIASQLDSIRHWRITEGCYRSCPLRGNVTWFLDPPYQSAGRHYRYGSELLDYDHLGLWCRDRQGQVIVCENDGARWLPFRHLADTRTTRGQRSKEVMWLKGGCIQTVMFT